MTNESLNDRQSTKLEAEARRELLKRMEHPFALLQKAVSKETEKRAQRVDELSEYKTEDDIREAFGWGAITDDERYDLIKALEVKQADVAYTVTKNNIALGMLGSFMARLRSEAGSLEFDLLPQEEQNRRLAADEERRNKRRRAL